MLLEKQEMLHQLFHPGSTTFSFASTHTPHPGSTTFSPATTHTPPSLQPTPHLLAPDCFLFPELAGDIHQPPRDGARVQADISFMFPELNSDSPPRAPDHIETSKQTVLTCTNGGKTFAGIVAKFAADTRSSEATVYDDGDSKSVRITQSAFDKRVQECRNSLIGRMVLNKGDKPWKLDELKQILTHTWGLQGKWRLISIGKGFYHALFPSDELKQFVWSRGTLNLRPGFFRLQPWHPDFDPNVQKTTHAQIWVRLIDLPWVYWDAQILADIAKCLGGLMRIDRATLEGDFGHFARLLIDIDMAAPLPTSIGIEREGKKFWVNVVYENIPSYCKLCSSIGHAAFNCKQNKKPVDEGDNLGQQGRIVKRQKSKQLAPGFVLENNDERRQASRQPPQRTPDNHRSLTPPQCERQRSLSPGRIKHSRGRTPTKRIWKRVEVRHPSRDTVPINHIVDRLLCDLKQKKATEEANVPLIDPLAKMGADSRRNSVHVDEVGATDGACHISDSGDHNSATSARAGSWADHMEEVEQRKLQWQVVKNKKKWKQEARSVGASRKQPHLSQ